MSERMMYVSCPNCNAVILRDLGQCPVCGLDFVMGAGETVRFSDAAREASGGLGGLLEIVPANGRLVQFIGRCPGGLFGIDHAGNLIWRGDWGYIVALDIESCILRVNGIGVNIDTGSSELKGSVLCEGA